MGEMGGKRFIRFSAIEFKSGYFSQRVSETRGFISDVRLVRLLAR